MAVLSNTGIRAGASIVTDTGPYNVKRSARFNNDDSAYLNWTPAAAGNKRKWTFSCWVKKISTSSPQTLFSAADSGAYFIRFQNDELHVFDQASKNKLTSSKYRDPSAWYHITVAVDYDNATAADRVKGFINGEQVEWAQVNDTYDQADGKINGAVPHFIGQGSASDNYFDGSMTDVHFIDGTAKAATDFGKTDSTTGQWVPKKYSGSYGTNGFHLAMDPANSGTSYSDDVSGDGNYTGYTSFGTNVRRAFDGNLTTSCWADSATGSNTAGVLTWTPPTPISISSLKIYGTYHGTGDFKINGSSITSQLTQGSSTTWFTITGVSTLTNLSIHATNGSNTAHVRAIEINGEILVDHSAIGYDSSGNKNHWHENNLFGNEATVANENFKVVTYTGTGNAGLAITGVGFKPDFVWIKERGARNNVSHQLYDVVRGTSKMLQCDNTGAEADISGVTSFDTDGFTVGTNGGGNNSGSTYVAWCWKAGGAASANNTGTLNASVSANTTAGFSIATFNSPSSGSGSWGHGLDAAPDFVVLKERATSGEWSVYHSSDPSHYFFLNSNAAGAGSNNWTMTSTTAASDAGLWTGANTTHVGYCWTEKAGISKFGKYKGTGASGNVIDCGFTPAFVMIKRIGNGSDGNTTYGGWGIFDNKRDGDNHQLFANCDQAEGGRGDCSGTTDIRENLDFTENGFTLSSGWYETNDPVEYIFAAFAGSPGGDLDLLADTPGAPYDNELNGGGNYATLNTLACSEGSPVTNGGLGMAQSTSGHQVVAATMAVSSGKWWWEATIKSLSPDYICFGMWDTSKKLEATLPGYSNTNMWSIQQNTGKVYYNGHHNSTTISSYAAGDDIAIAYDNGSCYVYKNGVVENSGNPVVTGLTGDWAPIFHGVTNSWAWEDINFGQRPFKYTPRTGHKSLNAYNLSDPTITKGNTGFDTKLFTGTGSSQSTTGLEFEPDLVWIKGRSVNHNHHLFDQIRGVTKVLYSNSNSAEGTEAQTLTAFTSDGFTVGTDNSVNQNTTTYASWAWDAGTANTSASVGSSTNTAQTWSDGMKTSTAATTTYSTSGRTTTMGSGSNTDPFDADQTNFLYGKTGIAGTWLYLEFGTALSNVTSISFSTEYSCPSSIIKLNGTDVAVDQEADGGFREVTVTGTIPASLTEIAIQGNGGSSRLKWIKIDGKLLIDNGVTYNLPSIASTYRVNTNTGFSVVSWTGDAVDPARVAHGLNAKPSFIVVKDRDATNNWYVWHSAFTQSEIINLDTTGAKYTVSNYWSSSDHDSQTFGVYHSGGGGNNINNSDMITYCWSEVAGYSKFGTFVGNASTDGPFVWCGFRPKWIMLKNIDTASRRWVMLDNVRDPSNGPNNGALWANQDDAESVNNENNIDYLSNGFKLKCTNGNANESGDTFIFAAFAESPFKYSNAV